MERLGSVNSIHRYSNIARQEGGAITLDSGMQRINKSSTVCRVPAMPRVERSNSAPSTPIKPLSESVSRATQSQHVSVVKPVKLSDSICSNKSVQHKGMATVKPMQRIDNTHHANKSERSTHKSDRSERSVHKSDRSERSSHRSDRSRHRADKSDRSMHRLDKSDRHVSRSSSHKNGLDMSSVGRRYYQNSEIRRTGSMSGMSDVSRIDNQKSDIHSNTRDTDDTSNMSSLRYDESQRRVFNADNHDDSVFKIPTMDASFRSTIQRKDSAAAQHRPVSQANVTAAASLPRHASRKMNTSTVSHHQSSNSHRQNLYRTDSVKSVPATGRTDREFEVYPDKPPTGLTRVDSQRSVRSNRSTMSCSSRISRKKTKESMSRVLKDPNMGKAGLHKVKEGKRLQSAVSTRCNSFIRVSLIPDEANRSHCRSEVAMETNNPNYDEKFSFELMESDARKRVYISVWNIEAGASDAELLGCMSFGLKHIIQNNKAYDGWFYLLNEERGKQKHFKASAPVRPLRVNSRIPGSQSDLTASGTSDVEDDGWVGHDENIWTDTHHVSIKRGPDGGFGFTIQGSRPAKICKVEPGSTAEVAGLRENDHITRINTLNVNQAGSQDVANLIRYYKHSKIQLEVQRPYRVSDLSSMSHSVSQYSICSSTSMMSYKSSMTSQSMMSSKSSMMSQSNVSRQSSMSSFLSIRSAASMQSFVEGVSKKKRKLKRFASGILNKFR